MSEHFFPDLRNTRFQIIYERELLQKPSAETEERGRKENAYIAEKPEMNTAAADTLDIQSRI